MISKILLRPMDVLALFVFICIVKYWRWRTRARLAGLKEGLPHQFNHIYLKQDFCNHQPGPRPQDYN